MSILATFAVSINEVKAAPSDGCWAGWCGRGVGLAVSLSPRWFPCDGGAGGLLVGDGFVLGAGGEQRVSLGRGGSATSGRPESPSRPGRPGVPHIRGHPRRCRRKAPSTGRAATTPAPSSPVESSALSSLTSAPRLARCHLPSWPTAGLGKPRICAPSTARYGCGGPGGLVTVELADMLPTAMMTSSSGSPLPARTRVPSRKPSCCTRTPSGIWASPVATRRKPGNG